MTHSTVPLMAGSSNAQEREREMDGKVGQAAWDISTDPPLGYVYMYPNTSTVWPALL